MYNVWEDLKSVTERSNCIRIIAGYIWRYRKYRKKDWNCEFLGATAQALVDAVRSNPHFHRNSLGRHAHATDSLKNASTGKLALRDRAFRLYQC